MAQILVVEDNVDLAFGLRTNLEVEGHEVAVEHDGRRGLDRARAEAPDLILLDLMLPGMDGFHFLRELRRTDAYTPVLILTARGNEGDKVKGLRMGADDYVTKPFGVLELLARVEVLLRRGARANGRGATAPEPLSIGAVRIDPATRTVTRNDQPVALTPKEYDLLLALVARRGAIATREDLMREVWGYSEGVVSRTVDTHIAELRRKLADDPGGPGWLVTVRKVGYRIATRDS